MVYSAFPIDDAALTDIAAVLEKRFGRKLSVKVELDPSLIGGIRVVVGDEVLDTSVKARLEQMKVALTAADAQVSPGLLANNKKEGKSHATQSRRNF